MHIWKMITQVKNIRLTVQEKISTGNIYDLNQSDDGLARKFEFLIYINLSTFLGLKNPLLNFLSFLSSRAFWFVISQFLIKRNGYLYIKLLWHIYTISINVSALIKIDAFSEPDCI